MSADLRHDLLDLVRQLEVFDKALESVRELAHSDGLTEEQRERARSFVQSAEETKIKILEALTALNNEPRE